MKNSSEENELLNLNAKQESDHLLDNDIDVTSDRLAGVDVSKSDEEKDSLLQKNPAHFTKHSQHLKNTLINKAKINRANLSLKIESGIYRQSAGSSFSPSTPGQSTPKPIHVVVFLKEGTDYKLYLEKGKLTTAGEIKTMMIEKLKIPDNAKHFFAIWLISQHLELQLKDRHIPFLLRKQWHDLLISFSYCEEQEAILDEPVLVFQRSSFLNEKDEEKVSDDVVTKRLFEEARHNILNARYPVPVSDAEMLGGILARIDEGPYDESIHKPGYFKNLLSKYLPQYAFSTNKIIQYFNVSAEHRLFARYKEVSDRSKETCERTFLNYCRSLPFYGCAFFKGIISIDDKTLWRSPEKNIKIGINRHGLSLFKSSKDELIIFLPYDDISWGLLAKEDENGMDSLCLEFDCKKQTQQIFIESKQARMMDSMIESCVKYMEKLKIPKTPTSLDYSKLSDISFSLEKKTQFSLSRPFKIQ
uniref:FERM domain-containing protein 8 n=1 Tax=Hydra vulgaris TaxID=6087 RepID=T2M6J2_HYDVU